MGRSARARPDDGAGAANGAPIIFPAWLSLEQSDSDPLRFWAYVTAALAALPLPDQREALNQLLAQIRSADAPALESVLDALLAVLGDASLVRGALVHVVLILDDYHHLRTQRNHDTINYFVAH